MARKKITTTTVTDADEISLPSQNPDDIQEGETDLMDALRLIGAGQQSRYNVFKVSGRQGTPTGFCQTYDAETFSLEAIRETFGGGKYQVRVTNQLGRIIKHATFELMEPITPPKPPASSTLAGSIAEVKPLLDLIQPQQQNSGLTEMMMTWMKSQSDMMLAILNRPAPTPPPAPQQLGVADIVALLGVLKPTKETDPVETLMNGLKLGREMAGGEGETGMMDVAAKGLEMIGQLAKNQPPPAPRMRVNPRVTPVPVADPQIGNTPAHPAPAATQPNGEGETMGADIFKQLQWLKAQVNALIYQASRNAEPALYAEVMLDNLPPFITEEEISKRIGDAAGVDDLGKVDSRVLQHREWFERFRVAVIEILSDEEGDDAPPGGEIEGDDGMDGLGDV